MGKSRLVEEFTRIAVARGFAVAQGSGARFRRRQGSRTPFASLVRSLLGIAPGADEAARRAAAEAAIARASAVGRTGASSSTTCSTCRSLSKTAPPMTPWKTRPATRASEPWLPICCAARAPRSPVADHHRGRALGRPAPARPSGQDGRDRRRVCRAADHDLADRRRSARRGVAGQRGRRLADDHRSRRRCRMTMPARWSRPSSPGTRRSPNAASSARPATRFSSSSSCVTPRRART